MAEQVINLATFEFDTDRLQANLSALQSDFFKLKKEGEFYRAELKLVQKATEDLVKEQIKLVQSGKEKSKEYEENKKTIEQLNAAEEQLFKNQQNIISNQSRVKQELNATNKELKAYMTTQGEQTTLIEASAKALQTQVTNINQARASNTELLRVRNQLNPAIATEAKLIADLNARLDSNNKFIKTNASEYEKTKINIGNYTESIKEAIKDSGLLATATNALPAPLRTVISGFEQAGTIVKGAFTAYKESASSVASAQKEFATLQTIATQATEASVLATEKATAIGFQYNIGKATQTEVEAANTAASIANTTATEAQASATAAATVVTNASSASLKLFKIALISTGIGAIVVLLGSLVSYLTTTQSGIDALTAVTRPLQAVFQGLLSVANGLGKTLVDVFSNPKKAITDFANFVKQNLINRFTALGDIISGILNLDFGKVAESTVQAVTGVDNLAGKVANAASATANFLDEAAKKGAEIDRITKQIAKSQLEYNASQVAFKTALDEQLLISKDTSRSFTERAAAAEEIIRLTDENGKKEKAILDLELKRLKVKQDLKGIENLTNEDRQEEIDLIAKIDDADGRGDDARLEQMKVISGLRKEQHQQELERIKKENDLRLRNLNIELKAYIESQGDKKKSFADDIAFAEETLKKQLAINAEENRQKIQSAKGNKKELAIIQKEFDLSNLEAQNDFLAKQTELTIANANLEFELFKINQQKKVDANQFYNDELYNADLDRINKLAEAEAAQQTLLFTNGVINAEEYALAITQIDNKQRESNEAVAAQRDQAKKDKQIADLQIQDELNTERFNFDLGLQLERNEIRYQAEKEAAVKAGADMIEFEKLQAQKRQEIEDIVMMNKLQAATTTFSNLATLAGEESAAGKAFATVQATIDTYTSAVAAFKALAGIPIVGPALGGIAAAAAIKTGLGNVKKINTTPLPTVNKSPSYARGVIGVGTGTSDSIDANLSAGESVLTARATAMFPNEIAAINQAGGGVGLNGLQGSSSAMMQETVRINAENSINSQEIANAVYLAAKLGTAEGSQSGIKGLSTDRQIMTDAKF
jgi:hypothetical protein